MTGDDKGIFKVGSRKSELALIQTNIVVESLKEHFPGKTFEIITMTTIGDQILDKPLPKIGEKSLFTKELEVALKEKEVDLIVHSLKDLPTALPDGLAVGSILQREDARDSVILHAKHRGTTLATLPPGSVVGTSSLRRIAQLKRKHPHLEIKDIRGNLQTRLRKLDQGNYDAIILAVAGVHRMGWEHRISQILETDEMLYAVGQGALAVECRADDVPLFSCLNHNDTVLCCAAERALLCTLGGGCSAPVAVHTQLKEKALKLTGAVWSLDGQKTLQESLEVSLKESKPHKCNSEDVPLCGLNDKDLRHPFLPCALKLGYDVAQLLIDKGALKIIEAAKAEIASDLS